MITTIIIITLLSTNIGLSVLLYNSNKLIKEQERMINDCNSYHDRIYERLGSLKKYLS